MNDKRNKLRRSFWNFAWIATVFPVIYRFFVIRSNPGADFTQLDAALMVASAIATVAQVWIRVPEDSWHQVNQKLYKAISNTAIWIVNQTSEKISESEDNIKQYVTDVVDQKLKSKDEYEQEDAYRQADLRTLKKLWPYITPRIINHIAEFVGTSALDSGFITHSIYRYEDLRRDRAELHFVDENLETAFSQFDKVLFNFTRFLGNKTTTELIGGRWILLSEYQDLKLHPSERAIYNIDETRLQEFLDIHHEIESRAVEMQRAHTQLIKKYTAAIARV